MVQLATVQGVIPLRRSGPGVIWLIRGQLNAAQAIAGGRVQVSGDPEALARFQDLFPPFDFQAVGEQDESA